MTEFVPELRIPIKPKQPASNQPATSQQPASNQNLTKVQGYNRKDMVENDNEGVFEFATQPEVMAPKKRSLRLDYTPEFEAFWKAYPPRDANHKKPAFDSWRRLSADEQARALQSLPAFTEHYRKQDFKFLPMTTTFLNQGQWNEWADKSESQAASEPWWRKQHLIASMTDDRWEALIRKNANGTWPFDKLGPAPSSPGCLVPHGVIAKMGLADTYDKFGLARGHL